MIVLPMFLDILKEADVRLSTQSCANPTYARLIIILRI